MNSRTWTQSAFYSDRNSKNPATGKTARIQLLDSELLTSHLANPGLERSAATHPAISPHRRDNVLRFGDYDTTTLHVPPGTYDAAFTPSPAL
jgi:hypothetical protein